MRILQVVSSSATSGAERHTIYLAKSLRDLGHHVEVICPPIDWMVDEFKSTGATVHPVHLKERWGLPAMRFMSKLLKDGNFDLIHAHLSRAAYISLGASTIRGVPLVCTVHVETKEPVYRLAARGNNRLVAVSNFISGVLRGQGIKGQYIDVVYNGTDFHDVSYELPPSDVFREFHIPSERRVIGLVGRVAPEKGHHLAIEAFPNVLRAEPNAHLMFVGRHDGDFHDQLRRRGDELGLEDRVTYTGQRDDIPRLFDSMDFSILPSPHKESFGIAVIESMARSKPVVVSRVGGLSEVVIHEQTGLVVDANAHALGSGMNYLLQNREELERMGRNARMLIQEKFTLAQMVERLEAVYAKASRKNDNSTTSI
ncbi:glycosyltransferase family 4 protein [Kamptonema cortianum]|nr:glycosyltransferase family 4 protein [Geitlerinema splendidum]MDK3156222.1 glycosyltransferase family 4 protein [Kamptonema cortianum]